MFWVFFTLIKKILFSISIFVGFVLPSYTHAGLPNEILDTLGKFQRMCFSVSAPHTSLRVAALDFISDTADSK